MYAPIERPMINDVDPLLLHFRKVSIVLPFFPVVTLLARPSILSAFYNLYSCTGTFFGGGEF